MISATIGTLTQKDPAPRNQLGEEAADQVVVCPGREVARMGHRDAGELRVDVGEVAEQVGAEVDDLVGVGETRELSDDRLGVAGGREVNVSIVIII